MTAEPPRTPQGNSDADALARGASVTFLGHVTGRALGFLLTLFLTRWLGASGFGLFILALTIFQCVGVLSDIGLKYGALRFVALAEGRKDRGESRQVIATVVRYSLTASLVAMVVLGVSSPLLADWFRQPAFWWLIPLMALSLPFATVGTVLKSVLQAFKRLKEVAILENAIEPLVRIGVFVALAALGWGIGAAVASHLAAAICVFGAALVWLLSLVPVRWDRSSSIKEREILAFSVPLSLAHVAAFTMQWVDSLFLGYFTAPRDVGIYGAASRMAALGGMILLAASMSFAPQVNELHGRGDVAGIRDLYRQVTRWLIMLNLPILVLTVTFASRLLSLFGAEFRGGWPALLILAAATFIMAATGPAGDIVLMAGRSRIVLVVGVLLAVTNIGLNWGLVARWGVLGAAIATGLTIAISNVANVLLGWWFLALQPYSVRLIKPLVIGVGAILLSAVVASLVQVESVQGVLSFLLIWAVAYPIALMRLAADSEDRAMLRALLPWRPAISLGER